MITQINKVNLVFNEFSENIVNLDNHKTQMARSSRDFLRKQVRTFDNFFPLYIEKDINFGSFARRTKIRPLDDIDMIFTLSANGCKWTENAEGIVSITTPINDVIYRDFCHDNTYEINSRKVINHFIRRLAELKQYKNADIHRNKNAVTLQLSSYDWNFDIVPAFFTTKNIEGRDFYIIPDGNGNWIKTDPRIDQKNVTEINKKCGGKALNIIRLIKYWNKKCNIPSYLLESLVLYYFCKKPNNIEITRKTIAEILHYISCNITKEILDPKQIQGNINNLDRQKMLSISTKAYNDHIKAMIACSFEQKGEYKKAIDQWGKVFDENFSKY